MRLPGVRLPSGMMVAAVLLVACVVALSIADHKTVRAAGDTCNVVIAMDRSASIGTTNWNNELRNKVRQLGNYQEQLLTENKIGKKVQIAFWTFSHTAGVTASTDFNAPHSSSFLDVNDPGTYNALSNVIPQAVDTNPGSGQMILEGQTNYAQGLGYDAQGTALPLTLSQNSGISTLASQANVIVLLTDGLPNYPGGFDENPLAKEAGRQARLKYGDDVKFVGGFISNTPGNVPASLKYMLNGDENDATGIGPLSFGGTGPNSIYGYLAGDDSSPGAIAQACNAQVTTSGYNLQPIVNPELHVITSGTKPTFNYVVNNDSETARTSGWQIFDVVIDHENTTNSPFTGDNISDCAGILSIIGGSGGDNHCELSRDEGGPTSSTGSSFLGGTPSTPGFTQLGTTSPPDDNIDSYPAGTRICRVLRLSNANGSGRPRLYGDCAVIGKVPLVQIHGGDVRVGRVFSIGDTDPDAAGAGIYTSKFMLTNDANDKKVFGSWVEYGALAPGPIMSFASGSGYAGGYIPNSPVDSCHIDTSRLTFANVRDTGEQGCGHLSQASMGQIPDIVSAVKASFSSNTFSDPSLDLGAISQGRHEITSDNIEIQGTAPPGTYIIDASDKTVNITGNIGVTGCGGAKCKSIEEIPQIIIIAKNILIKHNVTRIDAWLVAKGDDNNGVINTCSDITPPFTGGQCKDQLQINGPIMARQLQLWRTTVYADTCELGDPCVDGVDQPGERINLPGSTLLWAFGQSRSDARVQTTYTTELPPYY